MDGRGSALREHAPGPRVRVHRMGDAALRSEQADRVEIGNVVPARAFEDEAAFRDALRGVRVDREALLRGHRGGAPQQIVGARDREARLHRDAQAPALAPVPRRVEALRLCEPFVRGREQLFGRRRRIVHEDVAARVADARARRRAEEGVRMAHGPHVEDRRHAGREALGEAQPRRDRQRLRIVRRLARPHVEREPGKELQILGPVSQQRLAEMQVRLHEPRQHPLSIGLQPLDRLPRPRRQTDGLRADRGDRAVLGVEVRRRLDVEGIGQAHERSPLEQESAHAALPSRVRRTGGGS